MSTTQIRCSTCRKILPAEDVNVTTDVAFCRSCNQALKLSTLVHEMALDPAVDLERPPDGAWYSSSALGSKVGATQRSIGGAIGTFFFGAFWNGIVSIFVAVALASTLNHLGVPMPDWVPASKQPSMGVGMTIFLWIFLLPFIGIGLLMIAGFFCSIAGRTEARLNNLEGTVVSGVGPFSWRKEFYPDSVKDVRIETRQWRDSDGDRNSRKTIIIETHDNQQIKFGSSLREDRMKFLAAGLRKILLKQPNR